MDVEINVNKCIVLSGCTMISELKGQPDDILKLALLI
jgi:hypothetical protein